MIKLKSLYNEIKILGNITPEIYIELDDKITEKGENNSLIWTDLNDMYQKYGYTFNDARQWDFWVKSLKPDQLRKMYNDLLLLKQKYKIK